MGVQGLRGQAKGRRCAKGLCVQNCVKGCLEDLVCKGQCVQGVRGSTNGMWAKGRGWGRVCVCKGVREGKGVCKGVC